MPRIPWTEERWDDCNVYNERAVVYLPQHPQAWKGTGHVYRSHAVWWLHTGQIVPEDFLIHHKDENRLNDVFDNLELISRVQHQRRHLGGPAHGIPTRYTNGGCRCELCTAAFKASRLRHHP